MTQHISGVAASFDVFKNLGIVWCNVSYFEKIFKTRTRYTMEYNQEKQVISVFASTFPCGVVWYSVFQFSIPRILEHVIPHYTIVETKLYVRISDKVKGVLM